MPATSPAAARPTASAIHPQGVLLSEDAGSAATVSTGVVSVVVGASLVVAGSLAVGTVGSVGTVIGGSVVVSGGGVVGASAVVVGEVSVRVGSVGKVRLNVPVGSSGAPEKPGAPEMPGTLAPPPAQPASR
jgi:hypothetical protein